MSEATDTNTLAGPFENHEDNPAWNAGFEYGTWLSCLLTCEAGESTSYRDLMTQAGDWAAKGQCMVCGATDADEYPPRLPGRDPVKLCGKHLREFLRPGDFELAVTRPSDEPMWHAGLLAALAEFATRVKLPDEEDLAARRDFWRNLGWRVQRESCSLCPGILNTTDGGTRLGGVSVCGRCKVHLREQAALLAWTGKAAGAAS